MKSINAYIFALLTAILWASTAAVSRILLNNLDGYQVLFFSTLFATVTLLGVALVQGKLPVLRTYGFRDHASFALMGFIGVFLYTYFIQNALLLMPAQEAFIISCTWPIMTVVFAWIILKERLSMRLIGGMLLSFIGVVIVITKGNLTAMNFNVQGALWALATAVAYGLYSVLGKRAKQEQITGTAMHFAFAFVISSVALLFFSKMPSALSLGQIAGLLWLGVFTSGFGYLLWLLALKFGNTARISNIMFLEPFLSLIYIYFLLGERILIVSVLGLIFIVAGQVVQSLKHDVSA